MLLETSPKTYFLRVPNLGVNKSLGVSHPFLGKISSPVCLHVARFLKQITYAGQSSS
jgi:hypothetical protein